VLLLDVTDCSVELLEFEDELEVKLCAVELEDDELLLDVVTLLNVLELLELKLDSDTLDKEVLVVLCDVSDTVLLELLSLEV